MCDKHQFVFEFDKAYNQQLIEKFEASPEHPLAPDVAQAAERRIRTLLQRRTSVRGQGAEHHGGSTPEGALSENREPREHRRVREFRAGSC